MDKRRFLKAVGMTSVASLLAAPFLTLSASSSAFAQEGSSLEERFEKLQEQFANLQEKLKNEIRDREAGDAALSNSFIGSVVAIPYASLADVPKGWHLCDGSVIPQTDEYAKLRALGLTNFPDYRGVFLRGLDEGVGKAPGRALGSFQDSDNKAHNHTGQTGGAGGHNHGGATGNRTHSHGAPQTGAVGGLKIATLSGWKGGSPGDVDSTNGEREPNVCALFEIQGGNHNHDIPKESDHTHPIPSNGGSESRPQNVSVRYIIKYA